MYHFRVVGSSRNLQSAVLDQVKCIDNHLTGELGREAKPEEVQEVLKELVGMHISYAQDLQECYIVSLASEEDYIVQELLKSPTTTDRLETISNLLADGLSNLANKMLEALGDINNLNLTSDGDIGLLEQIAIMLID